jgi:hypothetical protein
MPRAATVPPLRLTRRLAAARLTVAARWRRRRSGPLDVVLPENDVLVDKVAQRSVHGLHAPHVKLPRHCHQPLPRRRRRAAVGAEYSTVANE